ncbi:hypothetical protein IWW38_004643, partial [Coemansia aciculifera]
MWRATQLHWRLCRPSQSICRDTRCARRQLPSVRLGASVSSLAKYSTDTGSPSEEQPKDSTTPPKKTRIKYMAIKPASPALDRMVAKIKEGEIALDISKEIDAFKFTTEDLIRDLPRHRAHVLGGVNMTVSSADLMLASKDDMVGMLYDLRTKR